MYWKPACQSWIPITVTNLISTGFPEADCLLGIASQKVACPVSCPAVMVSVALFTRRSSFISNCIILAVSFFLARCDDGRGRTDTDCERSHIWRFILNHPTVFYDLPMAEGSSGDSWGMILNPICPTHPVTVTRAIAHGGRASLLNFSRKCLLSSLAACCNNYVSEAADAILSPSACNTTGRLKLIEVQYLPSNDKKTHIQQYSIRLPLPKYINERTKFYTNIDPTLQVLV